MVGDREYSVEGDQCRHCRDSGFPECPACSGYGWLYTTTTGCDYCDEPVVVAEGVTPVWRPTVNGPVLCADCDCCARGDP